MLKCLWVFTSVAMTLAITIPLVSAGEYTQIITVNDHSYEIEVGGSREPVNETIIIENLGEDPLVNPRISVDGQFHWFDVNATVREVTAVSRG